MTRAAAAVILGVLLGTPASAGFDEGLAVYVEGDYVTALREWRPLAEQGNARARYWLGFMYEKGVGVTQDHAQAARWYRLAADQGIAGAQVYLGTLYLAGLGVPHDLIEALKWYTLAASTGDLKAQKNRDTVMKYLNPAQIAEARRLAREWTAAFEERKQKTR